MANYFVINKPSNLIIGVATTNYIPADGKVKGFVLANDKALDKYYKLLKKRPEMLPDIGELMATSPFINEQVSGDNLGKGDAKPQKIAYRDVQPEYLTEREKEILAWVRMNPKADEYDIDDRFHTGSLAARAYLDRCWKQ